MNKFVVLGFGLVVAVEVVAFTMVDHRLALLISGAAAAVVLLEGRRLMNRSPAEDAMPESGGSAESMRRWITRTESMIRWADSSRADWDRHLRPRLAREFMLATGQRMGRDSASLGATGRIVFGDELWQWVDPSNVAQAGRREPGPGREALSEILERLERV
jgi:hypothetical protein